MLQNAMFFFLNLLLQIFFVFTEFDSLIAHKEEPHYQIPSHPIICFSIGIKHHSHILPYSMGLIENLGYPKNKINILFVSQEGSDDETIASAQLWSKKTSKIFRSTGVVSKSPNSSWMEFSFSWAKQTQECKYFFVTTPDIFLIKNSILKKLISLNFLAVSPLLKAPFGKNYSNVPQLLELDFSERKSHQVAYFELPILIDLKDPATQKLTFDDAIQAEKLSKNPFLIFGFSALSHQIPLFVDNQDFYGYILDSNAYSQSFHRKLLGHFLANQISDHGPMPFPYSSVLEPWYPPYSSSYGFDKIFFINLKRRPERFQKMSMKFQHLGIEAEAFEAVDGRALKTEDLAKIQILPGYKDPYGKRDMKMGEVGCFLSHYKIWEKVIENGYERVIIFEDDVRFEENFTIILTKVMEDIMKTQLEWDLIFLGRKKLTRNDEYFVPNHTFLSNVEYSYWALGYMLSHNGAQKLIAGKPLETMLPVDEYIPLMYDKHPNHQWSNHFPRRDLMAFTIRPEIVTPDRYTSDNGHVSDTESSNVITVG